MGGGGGSGGEGGDLGLQGIAQWVAGWWGMPWEEGAATAHAPACTVLARRDGLHEHPLPLSRLLTWAVAWAAAAAEGWVVGWAGAAAAAGWAWAWAAGVAARAAPGRLSRSAQTSAAHQPWR